MYNCLWLWLRGLALAYHVQDLGWTPTTAKEKQKQERKGKHITVSAAE
jgi:hypothetical protein